MPPSWRADTLPELAASLAARPGHETVRTHLAEILRHGLGVRAADLKQEDYRARDHLTTLSLYPAGRGREGGRAGGVARAVSRRAASGLVV
jgi:hypothetical protein